ncbi:MAG: rhomboid family intramembrane serine protease, partial [Proteobacteria bacterium]
MKNSKLIMSLIAVNILVFYFWQTPMSSVQGQFMQEHFAVSWQALQEGRFWTLITSVFSHYSFMHLLFNMLVLN